MKEFRLILTLTRIILVTLIILGSFFGFPNDSDLCGFFWFAVLMEEIGCVFFLK